MSDCCCNFGWTMTRSTLSVFLYVWGGNDGSADLDENERLDPLDNWVSKTVLPSPARSAHVGFGISGDGYAASGQGPAGRLDDTDHYSVSGDSWDARAVVPAPARNQALGVAVGSFGYCICGVGFSGGAVITADTDKYDPSGDSWSSVQDAITARFSVAGGAVGDKVYVVYGRSTVLLQTNEEYDATGDSWSSKTSGPSPARDALAGMVIGSNVYTMGGRFGGFPDQLADTEKYDTTGDSWTAMDDLTNARRFAAASSMLGTGYVISGTQQTGFLTSVEEYDESGDVWSSGASLVSPARSQHSAVTI